MRQVDALAGCAEEAIVDLIEAYEAKRWPLKDPNVPGGKGQTARRTEQGAALEPWWHRRRSFHL